MSFEHLLSEFLVSSILYSIDLKTVGIRVYVVELCESVRNTVEHEVHGRHHPQYNFGIRILAFLKVSDIFCDVVCHLGSRSGSSVVVLNHAVVQLWGHSDDHVVVVRVEESSLRHIQTKRRVVVETGHQVIDVVDVSGVVRSSLGEILGPETSVGVLCVMHSEIRGPYSIMDRSLSIIPFLEEITLILLMCWMHFSKENHLIHKFSLFETLINK